MYDYNDDKYYLWNRSTGQTIGSPITTLNMRDNTNYLQPTSPKNFWCTNATSWGQNPEFGWEPPDHPTGTTLTYNIYWNTGGGYQQINGNPIAGTTYTHTGVELDKFGNTTYYYIKAKGANSPESVASNIVQIQTDHASKKLAEKYVNQNEDAKSRITSLTIFPDPFNPSTTISYTVANDDFVCLSIYNINGQQIVELVNGQKQAGEHKVNFNASASTGGIYFVRFQFGDQLITKKIFLLK